MPHTAFVQARQPLPATLIAWSLPDDELITIRDAVGRDLRLVTVRDAAAAATFVRLHASLCVVIPVVRDRFDPFWTEYTQWREHFPNVPVIAVAPAGVSSMQAAIRLSQLGTADLLDANDGLRHDDIRVALSRAFVEATATRVWQAVSQEFADRGDRCPDDLVTLFKRGLRHAHGTLPASRLAALMQMHERTLRKYCESRGFPSPQMLAGWVRLLTAALYLDEPGRTIAGVAELLAFPTPSALRKQIVRYTGLSPRELRDAGALRTATARLRDTLRPSAPDAGGRPRLVLLRDEGAA